MCGDEVAPESVTIRLFSVFDSEDVRADLDQCVGEGTLPGISLNDFILIFAASHKQSCASVCKKETLQQGKKKLEQLGKREDLRACSSISICLHYKVLP